MDLRDEPNDDDMNRCFEGLTDRNGRVYAVFTSQALYHYNQRGQFASAMGVEGLEDITEEVFWPNAKHIFPIEAHRNRLIDAVSEWAGRHLTHFQSLNPE
ncbi:hypothetical protein GCM10009113_03900 [Marinobacter szutsaonensis]